MDNGIPLLDHFGQVDIKDPEGVAKLAKDEYVSMEIIVKVCEALSVEPGDIMELKKAHTDI